MVEKEGFQYIKSELGLGFGTDDAAGIAVDGAVGVAGLASTPISIAALVNGFWESIAGGFKEEKVYDKGVKIAEQGSVLSLFNLYCVSSALEKGGKETGRNYSVYPSYQEKDSTQISTEECIENFNRNFGKDGIFKDARERINFTKPLLLETLLSEDGFQKAVEMINNWETFARDKGYKFDDAVSAVGEGQ